MQTVYFNHNLFFFKFEFFTSIHIFRFTLLNSAKQRSDKEGLNTIKYEIIKIEKNFLYTRLFVNYNQQEIIKGYN